MKNSRIIAGLTLTGLDENYKDSYLTLENGHILLNVVAVPEPATACLLGLAGVLLWRRRALR